MVVKLSTGAVMQLMEHDEFGRIVQDTNPGYQPFGFAGGEYDKDTKLVRFGARDYDPETGRWTSKDPILFGGGDTNLFSYSANDPVNNIDPTGLKTVIRVYSNNAGHISVQVGNDSAKGFYPATSNLLSSPGRIQDDGFRSDVLGTIVIDTTPEQERAISNYYASHGFADNYGVYSNNCAAFAGQALKAGGVNVPNMSSSSNVVPLLFFNNLGAVNGY